MTNAANELVDMESVIERARKLDPDAFDVLVNEYAPRIRGFLRRIVRGADVDDMVQELFLRVVRTIGSYQEVGRFEAWIFQIARNLAYDQLRESVRRPAGSEGFGNPERVSRWAATETLAEKRLEETESASQIENALQRLPEPEREVILLRHFGHLSFEEIARMMNTPLGTALARSHRGLARLREWVEETT